MSEESPACLNVFDLWIWYFFGRQTHGNKTEVGTNRPVSLLSSSCPGNQCLAGFSLWQHPQYHNS